MRTQSKASNAQCAAYAGLASESAASIITKVGQACGISQKALLVMLEKEQSLVTDTWPITRMYDYAMGWACPDDGPGNSANCDPASANFFTQVYKSAWQLKVYLNNPSWFNYRAGVNNTIQWHPNSSCGTSTFKIKNNATAALYIYTPYRPNAAALRAGWGTGDSCSSYGNRNFYSFWKSWFGSPTAPAISGSILKYYNANNGATKFGEPTSNMQYVSANGGGYMQSFQRGMIFTSNKLGNAIGIFNGAFVTRYKVLGGPASTWGWPKAHANCDYGDGACSISMQNGEATYTKATGVVFMPALIAKQWLATGAQSGPLGFPSKEAVTPVNGRTYQRFLSGSIMAKGNTTYALNENYTRHWESFGGYSKLGLVNGKVISYGAKGVILPVERGLIALPTSKNRVFMGRGAFMTEYLALNGPDGAWGWPLGAGVCGLANGGCTMQFENGIAAYSPNTGVQFVASDLATGWEKLGGVTGSLGYPTGSIVQHGDQKVSQSFQKGELYLNNDQYVRFGAGAFLNAYRAEGGPDGAWGWPLGAGVCGLANGGCTMQFENGIAAYSPNTGVQFVASDLATGWEKLGGVTGSLGYPTGSIVQHGDQKVSQSFQKGELYLNNDQYVRFGAGAFLNAYRAEGGPDGAWGWPLGAGVCGLANGGCTMQFENGIAAYSPNTGVQFVASDLATGWENLAG